MPQKTNEVLDLKKKLESLKEIKANLEKIDQKYKEIKGECGNPDEMKMEKGQEDHINNLKNEMEYMYRSMGYMRDYMYQLEGYLYGYVYEHDINHVPKLKTASSMEKFLKAVGLSDDFEVVKPTIYVSAEKSGPVLNLNYKKDNK